MALRLMFSFRGSVSITLKISGVTNNGTRRTFRSANWKKQRRKVRSQFSFSTMGSQMKEEDRNSSGIIGVRKIHRISTGECFHANTPSVSLADAAQPVEQRCAAKKLS